MRAPQQRGSLYISMDYNVRVPEERPKGTRLEGRGQHDLGISEQRLAGAASQAE